MSIAAGASVLALQGKTPSISEATFVADGARIIGDVSLAAGASVWYNAVLRGDSAAIVIGPGSNVQDNVSVHVGEDAPAWVMVQDLGDSVSVTVRDDGPGIPEGRLAEAAAAGRLGVSGSIEGRLADLGGEARLSSGSFGTEWELVVPR